MVQSSTKLFNLQNDVEIKFKFEDYVINSLGLDIYGENKKNTSGGVCLQFLKGKCDRGLSCPYKHIRMEKAVVCKHWLRGLCKKEDQCEFLHEYNLKKMPECWFYSKYGECASGEECIYLHIDPLNKIPECPWYNRGFCKHGPNCKSKHVRKIPCALYLNGFCPLGLECSNGHPKFELPVMKDKENMINNFNNQVNFNNQNNMQNNFNNQNKDENTQFTPMGNQRNNMNQQNKMNLNRNNNYQRNQHNNQNNNNHNKRPLEEVTCFKCNQLGHYANHCPMPKNYMNNN